mgnify:CR=1 FL=1
MNQNTTLIRKQNRDEIALQKYTMILPLLDETMDPAALRELEKIELIRQPGGHYKVDHAITATQKTILGAFGIEEGTILAKAVLVGKELENAFAPETEDENGTNQEYEDD